MQFDLFSARSSPVSTDSPSFPVPSQANQQRAPDCREWIRHGLQIAAKMLPEGELMGEEFRRLPLPEPGHQHWWGLLVSEAVAAKIIRDTGRRAPAESRKNHGHKYAVYERVPPYRAGEKNPPAG